MWPGCRKKLWHPLRNICRFTPVRHKYVDFHHINTPQPQVPLTRMFNNDPEAGAIKVPGYGHTIDRLYYADGFDQNHAWEAQPTSVGFSHGFSSWIQMRRNLVREIHMIRVMDALTDKPQWDIKVFNNEILAKWKIEAMELPGRLISEMAWNWIVEELRWKAVSYQRTGYMTILETGSTLVKSDTYIEQDIRHELQEGVKPLLDVSNAEKDWHPGSNGKVLNLVHPSLYPLVYGRTKIFPDHKITLDNYLDVHPDDGITLPAVDPSIFEETVRRDLPNPGRFPYPELWSPKSQWLPCDVSFVGSSGTDVKITSPINNLDPSEHRVLYTTIEKIISKSIIPWNEVLRWDDPNHNDLLRINHTDPITTNPPPPEHMTTEIMYEIDPNNPASQAAAVKTITDYLSLPENPDRIPLPDHYAHLRRETPPYDMSFTGTWWRDHYLEATLYSKWERIRVTSHPEPNVSESFSTWQEARSNRLRPTLQDRFRDRGLQVIVKLSSIELTPEKPNFPTGNWHLEGKMNEHIVATSIYYYSTSNITESRVSFRQESQLDSSYDVEYDSSNHGPLEDAYGTKNLHDCEAIQDIGSVVAKEGRLLVFPNIVQHRVEGFELADRAKKGHRRVLVIWLVDPHYRVLSTANVPAQQWDWWRGEAGKEEPEEWPVKKEDAKRIREEMMEERTNIMELVEGLYERYNFCEH